VTTCGVPDVLTRLGARTFLLLPHLYGSQNKYQDESARTEARQLIGSAKQVSKLSHGQNKHGSTDFQVESLVTKWQRNEKEFGRR